jgi:hypothetical protein
MYTLKWSVMQYVIIRPRTLIVLFVDNFSSILSTVISIIGIVCEVYHVLGYSCGYSYKFAEVYLEAIDFVSISFALYGLIVFYGLTKDELTNRRPLAKFLSIKLIVMFTFYQSFVVSCISIRVEAFLMHSQFSALEGRGIIHASEFWTATNVADGLNALCICIEVSITPSVL